MNFSEEARRLAEQYRDIAFHIWWDPNLNANGYGAAFYCTRDLNDSNGVPRHSDLNDPTKCDFASRIEPTFVITPIADFFDPPIPTTHSSWSQA